MPKGVYKRKEIANGVRGRPGMIRTSLAIPEDLFESVKERAIKESTSFAQQVTLLLEWGLEADKEDK